VLPWAKIYSNTVYIKLASVPFHFTTSLTAEPKRKIEIPREPQNYHSRMGLHMQRYFQSYHCPW